MSFNFVATVKVKAFRDRVNDTTGVVKYYMEYRDSSVEDTMEIENPEVFKKAADTCLPGTEVVIKGDLCFKYDAKGGMKNDGGAWSMSYKQASLFVESITPVKK